MFDELNEVAQNTFAQEQEQPQEKPQEQQVAAQESQKEASLRALRERAEAAERKSLEAERRSLELERMIQANMSSQKNTKMQLEEPEEEFDVSDDTYVEGKHLKKYVKSLKQELRNTKKQFEEYSQQTAVNNAEMRLKSEFADFTAVVNPENIEKLKLQKPALARTIFANNDIYDRGYAAYELIKSSGILNDQYQQLDKRVEENKAKPRSSANVAPQSSETPLSRVGDYDRRILTPERKEQIMRQVEENTRYR